MKSLFVATLLFCGLVSLPGHGAVSGFNVSALPLTTVAQKDRHVAGGEGFQLVMSIAYAASNPSVVYLASDTSQVWKSVDGGASWRPRNSGYRALASRSLFVHPLNENIVFSAGSLGKTFKRAGDKDAYQGIYRSIDGGDSWEMVHETDFFKQDSRGALFALDSRTLTAEKFTLYAGSYSEGLLVSHDSGVRWQVAGFSQGKIHEIVEMPGSPGTLLIATDKGLFSYGSDEQRELGVGLATWPRSIAVSPDNPDIVFAALGQEGVYKSFDGGRTFNSRANLTYLFGSINDVEVSPVDADIAILTKSGKGGEPYYTSDGGKSWKAAESTSMKGLSSGGGFMFPSPIAMHPDEALTALTSSNGKSRVLITRNGGKDWSYSGSGYRGGRLRDVVFISDKEMIFNLTDHGAWLTTDDGLSFKPVEHPRTIGRSVGGGAKSGDTLVLAVGSWKTKHLLVSKDRGASWNDTKLTGKLSFVSHHKDAPKVFYAGEFRSDDAGKSWTRLAHELVALDPVDNNKVYALKGVGGGTRLLVSEDRGDNWKELGANLPASPASINRVEVDHFRPGRIYAATGRGLWILQDLKWKRIGNEQGLEEDAFGGNYVDTVVSHPSVTGLLVAGKRSPGKGMSNGLFYSLDYGESWQPIPDSRLSNTNTWSVNVNPYDGTIYAGTAHGVYRIELVNTAE